MNIEKANTEATERMMEARPVLVGLGKARDVIPGMRDNLLLHAGPLGVLSTSAATWLEGKERRGGT